MIAALLWATDAVAQEAVESTPTQEAKRVVAIDHKLRASIFFAVEPDCTIVDLPVVRVIDAPTNGNVTISSDTGFPAFARDNLRFECNKKRLEGTALIYEPAKG